MTLKSSTTVIFALLFTAGAIGLESQVQDSTQPKLADTILADSGDPIVLAMPASAFTAMSTIERVLNEAGVRYGFETPPFDPTRPLIDLARFGDSQIRLSGLRLGDALDTIVKAVPQYRWTERDGAVIVRGTNAGSSVLDRKVPRFRVAEASPRVLIETLLAVLDPARLRGHGVNGVGRPGGGGAMNRSTVVNGTNVTVDLANATVEQILTTIARLNGVMTWSVSYEGLLADYDHAVFTFAEHGEPVTAISAFTLRSNPQAINGLPALGRPVMFGPGTIQITSTLASTITQYVSRNNVRVDVEELPSQPLAPDLVRPLAFVTQSMPTIDLTGIPVPEAMLRLVALDSRYELKETGGRFLVRPKPGVPGRLDILDQKVDGFSASNEPMSSVIQRISERIGTFRAPPAGLLNPGAQASPLNQMLAKPISFTLPAGATVRDVLGAISDAANFSWTMRPSFRPGSPTSISLQWRGTTGSTSTPITLATDLSPTPLASRLPARRVPPALDRTIPRLSIDLAGAIDPIEQLGRAARVPMGIETRPRPALSRDPRFKTRPQQPTSVGPGNFSDALYVLLERAPEYEIVSTNGAISVAPTTLLREPKYFLNQRVESFVVKDEELYHALGRLRQQLNAAYQPQSWTGASAAAMNRHVTASFTRATVRDIVNELVRLHGGLLWSSHFDGGTPFSQAEVQEADWLLVLVPIDDAGPPVMMGPVRPAAERVVEPPVAPTGPLVRPAGPPVTIDLPASPARGRSAFQSLARAFNRPAGIETVTDTLGSAGFGSQYYDLTGLPAADALAKLASLLPEYTFSDERGVMHMQPRALVNDPANWLNMKVDKFEQHFDNARDALNAIAAIRLKPAPGFPPMSSSGVTGGIGPPPTGLAVTNARPSTFPDTLTPRLVTSITIAMSNVTVREILDEMVRQHGSMTWTLDHRASIGQMSLTFGSQGWSIGTSVR